MEVPRVHGHRGPQALLHRAGEVRRLVDVPVQGERRPVRLDEGPDRLAPDVDPAPHHVEVRARGRRVRHVDGAGRIALRGERGQLRRHRGSGRQRLDVCNLDCAALRQHHRRG